MMLNKELEFNLRILKGLIKIAKELYRNKKDPLEFFEELRKEGDVDTAFALGALTAIRVDPFRITFTKNLLSILEKLEGNKSEEKILKEFEEELKEKRFDDFKMYGG